MLMSRFGNLENDSFLDLENESFCTSASRPGDHKSHETVLKQSSNRISVIPRKVEIDSSRVRVSSFAIFPNTGNAHARGIDFHFSRNHGNAIWAMF